MNLLNKLTIKNLKLNKKRTIVTIIGIMLSVALITAVASIYSSAIKSLISFEKHEKGNFHVAYYSVPVNEIESFRNNRGIEEIFLSQNLGYAKIDSKNEYKPYAYVKAFTTDSLKNLSVQLIDGRLPENDNEILIPTHLKTNGRLSLNIGDSITLDVGKRVDVDGYELNQNNPFQVSDIDDKTDELTNTSEEKIIDTATKTYKIVGIIERPASNIESYSAPGYTFITFINENNINNMVDVYAKYTKNGTKNSYKITANILGVDEKLYEKVNKCEETLTKEEENKYLEEMEKAKYETNINSYLIALQTNPISESGIGGLGVVVGIVMGIIVFTSVFCIKNSFDISITEKIKQYGMLRSIGATKKQIKKNVFYEATALGVIGIPLGIIMGFLASFILVIISNYFLKDMLAFGLKLEFSFSFIALLVALILGIVTIYFSAFRSARRASIVVPIESIRNSANIKINSKNIKSPKIIKKIFGIGGEISFKNLKRNKKKYRTTVISIVVSVFVFIALSSFMSMAFDFIELEFKMSEYNISLSTHVDSKEKYNKYTEITRLENIENYTILRNKSIKINDFKYNPEYISWVNLPQESLTEEEWFNFYILDKESYKKYVNSLDLNYNDIKDKIILIDYQQVGRYIEEKNKYEYKYMSIYDFKENDIINFKDQFIKYENLEIGHVTDKNPFGLKYIDGAKFIVSDELFDEMDNETKFIEIYLKSNNATKLQDDIDELLKGEDYYLYNSDEDVKMMSNFFTLIGIFLYGFIIVISLIGITNIFNTITTNMELRKQEFAMLKSVGMTSKEFNRMIRLESLFMGIKSLLFGIPIGIMLSYLIYYYLIKETGMPYKLPIVAIIVSILVVFVLISVIMKYSMAKINKQNTIETIRNENI